MLLCPSAFAFGYGATPALSPLRAGELCVAGTRAGAGAFVINCLRRGDVPEPFPYNRASAGRGPVTTKSSRFRSRPGSALAIVLVSFCASACASGAADTRAQPLTLWSGIAAGFTNDLIKRFNRALPQTHIDLQTAAGCDVVLSAIDSGHAEAGL